MFILLRDRDQSKFLFDSVHMFTARKRSLGQGNVFTPVCHSVHRWEGGLPNPLWMQTPRVGQTPWMQTSRVGQTPPWMQTPRVGQTPPGCRPPPYSQQAGGTHPTGMHTYFGICISLGQCEWTISGTQCKPNIGILVGVKFYVTAIRPSHVLILRKPPHITWSSKLIF